MKRLQKIGDVTGKIKKPGYNPEHYEAGIVHIGIGAFHRGHMAVYTDDVISNDGGNWRITGVSLRSADTRNRLNPQNGLFTLVERDEKGETYRLIGSIKNVLVGPEEPQAVLESLTSPATRIVSMTITEKGYLHDPASGALMVNHEDIVFDLEHPARPRTMHGYVVEALDRIRIKNGTPFTLLSCDNLPANGDSLRRIIVEFARLRDPELAKWIAERVIFPNTMVDRIVPATTAEDIEKVATVIGCEDDAPVICEPFSQWVIQDCMPEPRPAWEKYGATFVTDVAPYEEMKLRLLNCSHSAMAYLGYLGGFDYIHQVIADENYLRFIRGMMREEIIPTLHMPENVDLEAYCETLIQRFRNTTLGHRTSQIAMDGSQKIPPRALESIRERMAKGLPSPRLTLMVAAWLRYVTGIDEQGKPIEVSDPFAKRLRAIADQHRNDIPGYVNSILQVQEIFGVELPENETFRTALIQALTSLYEHGARKTVAQS